MLLCLSTIRVLHSLLQHWGSKLLCYSCAESAHLRLKELQGHAEHLAHIVVICRGMAKVAR
jgi:hypothetical protein